MSEKTKHIDIKLKFVLSELNERKTITLDHISTNEMLTDVLTCECKDIQQSAIQSISDTTSHTRSRFSLPIIGNGVFHMGNFQFYFFIFQLTASTIDFNTFSNSITDKEK